MAQRPALALSAAFASLLALAGCGVPGVATDRYAGVPPGVQAAFDDSEPRAIVADDGNLALVTYGSSSCPPTVTGIRAEDAGTITLSLAESPNDVCTADMAATTHVVPLPDEASGRPLTVHVVYTDMPWEFTIVAG